MVADLPAQSSEWHYCHPCYLTFTPKPSQYPWSASLKDENLQRRDRSNAGSHLRNSALWDLSYTTPEPHAGNIYFKRYESSIIWPCININGKAPITFSSLQSDCLQGCHHGIWLLQKFKSSEIQKFGLFFFFFLTKLALGACKIMDFESS